jgi:hypothetical protein
MAVARPVTIMQGSANAGRLKPVEPSIAGRANDAITERSRTPSDSIVAVRPQENLSNGLRVGGSSENRRGSNARSAGFQESDVTNETSASPDSAHRTRIPVPPRVRMTIRLSVRSSIRILRTQVLDPLGCAFRLRLALEMFPSIPTNPFLTCKTFPSVMVAIMRCAM